MRVPELKLDDRLLRAMRGGPEALPRDLARLRSYLRLIAGLLEEKATEVESNWAQACAAAAELDTLQALEATVAERAIAVEAVDLGDVRVKLEIWRALVEGAPDGDLSLAHNRLILSIECDIARLARKLGG